MRKIACAYIGLLLAPFVVKATLVTQTQSVTLTSGQTSTLTFNKWDTTTSWGNSLASVYVSFDLRLSGASFSMYNDDPTGSAQATASILSAVSSFTYGPSLSGIGTASQIKSGLAYSDSQDFILDASTVAGAPVGHYVATGNSDTASWSSGTIDSYYSGNGYVSGSLSSYQSSGSGTFNTSLKAIFSSSIDFNGGNGYYQGNTASATYLVTITYDVVPEPSTWISASMLLFVVGGSAGRSYWLKIKSKA